MVLVRGLLIAARNLKLNNNILCHYSGKSTHGDCIIQSFFLAALNIFGFSSVSGLIPSLKLTVGIKFGGICDQEQKFGKDP
jgi:hypothetical protein